MKLLQLIGPDRIFTGLRAEDAKSALRQVAELIAPAAGIDAKTIHEALLEREKLGSTSIGDGFAIPHCKCQGMDEIVVAVARLEEPVGFGGPADEPVRCLFVVLSPPDQPAAHLQVLSQIARVLKRREVRRRLLEAESAEQILEEIRKAAEAEGM